jgi:hypothetical protein
MHAHHIFKNPSEYIEKQKKEKSKRYPLSSPFYAILKTNNEEGNDKNPIDEKQHSHGWFPLTTSFTYHSFSSITDIKTCPQEVISTRVLHVYRL